MSLVPVINETPVPTQGPCEVTILDGEALTGALLRVPCGNEVNFGLLDAVVAFNDNLSNADFVSPGMTLLVPLPSPTPIPEGADMTATSAALQGINPDLVPDSGQFFRQIRNLVAMKLLRMTILLELLTNTIRL